MSISDTDSISYLVIKTADMSYTVSTIVLMCIQTLLYIILISKLMETLKGHLAIYSVMLDI